jgi:hypothetical protein
VPDPDWCFSAPKEQGVSRNGPARHVKGGPIVGTSLAWPAPCGKLNFLCRHKGDAFVLAFHQFTIRCMARGEASLARARTS